MSPTNRTQNKLKNITVVPLTGHARLRNALERNREKVKIFHH